MTVVLAIDPGKMSGIAVWRDHAPALITTDELNVNDTIQFAVNMHKHNHDLEIVSEKFTISERTIKTSLSLDALDINGWLKLQGYRWSVVVDLSQTPTSAKKFATDAKLKTLDWFERTKDGHANDAARHLLVYLYRRHNALFSEHILPTIAKDIFPR